MKKLLIAVAFSVFSLGSFAQDLSVAAAADLNFVMPEIAKRFEKQTGKKLALTYGSSGNFYQQIRNGAPFDLFFSADEQYPAKLEREGFAEPGTLTPYAEGRLVLFAPSSSKINLSLGLRVLISPEIRKVAIANPQHAPYGRAAVDALTNAGIYQLMKFKIVLGEDISQTAQFVQSGNADAGILALSLVSAPQMQKAGRFVPIPETGYAPIKQSAIVVKSSKNKVLAREFLRFMTSPEVLALLSQYGFSRPAASNR